MAADAARSDDEVVTVLNEDRVFARQVAEKRGEWRARIKQASDEGVINPKALTMARRGVKTNDPEQVIRNYRDAIRYMRLMRLPITADDLFGGLPIQVSNSTAHQQDIWDAYEAGYKAGRHKQDIADCPYDPGSDLQAEWLRAWQAGEASIARELGPDAEQLGAPRKRRARQLRIPGTERRARPEEQLTAAN